MTLPDLAGAPGFYTDLGFDVVPLKPNGKDAILAGWPRRDPAAMWAKAPIGANVGIRGDGPALAAFIDCDETKRPGTLARVQNHLWGLGYEPGNYPVVQTASTDGRHIYLSFVGELPGDARLLAADVGAGEFRYGRGALVAAPPSIVAGQPYRLLAGDFRTLPTLAVPDVLPLLANKSFDAPPAPRVPARAWELLNGKGTDRYPTRSEAEQAIVALLVNAGHDFASVAALFSKYPAAGKFAELNTRGKSGLRWLRLCYGKAQTWATASESQGRQLARAALAWANLRAWPGRTGSVDRAVFLAHAALAFRAGKLAYGASARELAEQAGVTFRTAAAASNRLVRAGFLALHLAATPSLAAMFRLTVPNVLTFTTPPDANGDVLAHSLIGNVRECANKAAHDAFRRQALGKAGAEVWAALQEQPRTAGELAAITGRRPRTVRRALHHLARIVDPVTGEISPDLALVQAEAGQWRAVPGVDLDRVALVLGTAGKGKAQREAHRRERAAHRRQLSKGSPTGRPKD